MKKEFIENLIDSHFESFVFSSSVIDFVFVFINASQKNENLLDRAKIIEIFSAININVIDDVFNNTIDDEYDDVFIDRVMICIDE